MRAGGSPGGVQAIAAGHHYITPELAHLLAEVGQPFSRLPHALLTDREFQVLIKLAQGLRSEKIGREVSISAKTVT